jgi:large subunit ribosomal protein L25
VSTAPITLAATRRTETGKAAARLRKAGRIPAVVFGHGLDSIPVTLDALEFEHLRRVVHSNSIVELKIDGKDKHKVMIHGISVDPRHRRLLHVDLFELKSGEEVTVDIPLHATGESYAVDRLGGSLLHSADRLKLRALPEKLPEFLEYSIEVLADFDAAVHARDIALPADVALVTDPDEVVARVVAPRAAEVVAPVAEEAAAEAPAAEGSSES